MSKNKIYKIHNFAFSWGRHSRTFPSSSNVKLSWKDPCRAAHRTVMVHGERRPRHQLRGSHVSKYSCRSLKYSSSSLTTTRFFFWYLEVKLTFVESPKRQPKLRSPGGWQIGGNEGHSLYWRNLEAVLWTLRGGREGQHLLRNLLQDLHTWYEDQVLINIEVHMNFKKDS